MRNILLSTVAAGAFILMAGSQAQAADFGHPNYNATPSINTVEANQALDVSINDDTIEILPGSSTPNMTNKTGDITYRDGDVSTTGVFTQQNQTGLHNAGNNGTNIAAQVNAGAVNARHGGGAPGSDNAVLASQSLTTNIANSPISINTILTDGQRSLSRTGDIKQESNTFNSDGIYTQQNQTGIINAGNNGTNLSVQESLTTKMNGGSSNDVAALQTLSSTVDPSIVIITNVANVEGLSTAPNRTGDVTYGNNTFEGAGLFTLQNNTGINLAANNGTNFAVQASQGDTDSINLHNGSTNLLLASQDMAATVANSTVLITNDVDAGVSNRTGNVTYSGNTVNAAGVFTLSNNTGLNNASNNATNVAAQLNGI